MGGTRLGEGARGGGRAILASTTEALDAIWPFFLRLPAAFDDTGDYLGNLLKRLEALGQPPTPELLQRIETFAAKRRGSPGPSAG